MSDDEEELSQLRAQRACRGEMSMLRKAQPQHSNEGDGGLEDNMALLGPKLGAQDQDRLGSATVPTATAGNGLQHSAEEEDPEAAALRAYLPMAFGTESRLPEKQTKSKKGAAAMAGAEAAARTAAAAVAAVAVKRTGTAGASEAGPRQPQPSSEHKDEEDEEDEGGGAGLSRPLDDEAAAEERRQLSAAAAAVEVDEYGLPISCEATLQGHRKAVTALALDPAGSRLLTGSSDYTVKIYDFGGMKSDLRSFRELEPHDGHPVHALSWSPTGDAFLAITGAATAKIYTRDGTLLGESARGDMYIRDPKNTKGHISALTSGAWHPTDRATVMTASEDGTIRLWDASDDMKQKTVIKPTLAKQQRTAVTACAWNADGHMMAGGLRDGTIQIWSVTDKNFGTSAAAAVVAAPKQQMIAKQDWSYVGRPDQLSKAAHESGTDITSLAFSQSGSSLASRGTDGTLKLWDVRKMTSPVHTFDGLPVANTMTSCTWSPDQRILLTGTSAGVAEEAGAVVFFDVAKRSLIRRVGMAGCVTALAWHPRINQIFAGIGNRKAGCTRILYDPSISVKGVTTAVVRAPRKPDPLDFQPPLLIRAPHALPLFREDPTRKRPQRGRDEPDPKKVRMPARGNAAPGVGAQGRIGTTGGTLLTQHILRQKGKLVGVDEELDPREAILRHAAAPSDPLYTAYTSAYSKTQPTAIFENDEEDGKSSDSDEDEPVK